MALFTDGEISTVEDLRAYDTAVLEVASAEGVDLTAKLEIARSEIGVELEEFIGKRTGDGSAEFGGASTSIDNVVVTPALKQWHTLLALALIYGDVQGNHRHTGYQTKWQEYRRRARWASDSLWRTGVGLVWSPLPKPAAPALRSAPGTLAPRTYFVRVAWGNRSGERSEASGLAILTLDNAGTIAVTALNAPATAAGYDVYAGVTEDGLARQNAALVGPGEEWVLPESGLAPGAGLPQGQQPDWRLRNDRVLQRG